jgi:hypothetical protein
MLNFIEALKQVVADVQATGGAVVERSYPSPDLVRRLKEYAIRRIAETKPRQWVILDWFTEGFFDEYVRVCVVHLRKLTLEDGELHYRVLTKVIDRVLSEGVRDRDWTQRKDELEEQLAFSLAEIWDQLGDEQTLAYTFAKERWLIAWDYQESHWKPTGLGLFFLELSPIQAATFLLSVDTLFSAGERDYRHIGADVLRRLPQLPKRSSGFDFHLMPPHRDALLRLGILQVEDNDGRPNLTEGLTPVGKIVISRVLEQDNPLRDAAARLIETEELGGTYRDSKSEFRDLLTLVRQTELADDANRQSVIESAQLYDNRQYLASLRVLYPSIEAIVNSMITRAGEKPDGFRGLVEKARWLEQRGHIPPDVSNAVEVFTGRNRVLHGNFSPPDDYVFPLCLLAFRYLRRLLTEYRPDTSASAGSP